MYSEQKQALAAELSFKHPAVLAVSGSAGSGKTALLAALLPVLKSRGLKVGAVGNPFKSVRHRFAYIFYGYRFATHTQLLSCRTCFGNDNPSYNIKDNHWAIGNKQ